MVAVTYATLHGVMNITTSDISAIDTEKLIDYSIDLLNLYANQSITRMAGTPGSKTLTLTSAQLGAMLLLARALYYEYRFNPIDMPGMRPMNPQDTPVVWAMIQAAAKNLKDMAFERT